MNCDDCTYPPRDWTPVDLAGGDVDATALGFRPRALRANSEGTVVARFMDTPAGDPDRVLHLQAGEVLIGFVTVIKAESSATIHVAR